MDACRLINSDLIYRRNYWMLPIKCRCRLFCQQNTIWCQQNTIWCCIELLVLAICTLILIYVYSSLPLYIYPSNLLSLFRILFPQDHRLVLSCVMCICFDLILDSPVGLWAGVPSAGEWVPEHPASNPGLSRGIQLSFFWFKITSLCQCNYN